MDGSLSHEKILVVDDEADAREITRQLLSYYYARVFTAATAWEGLEKVRMHRPHLIVSDIGMPKKDGHQFMREIRSLPAPLGLIPAIALSAFTQPQDRIKSLEAGFQCHLTKPIDFQTLLNAIAGLLRSLEGNP
jgi:CheY-like chemotaxis protein